MKRGFLLLLVLLLQIVVIPVAQAAESAQPVASVTPQTQSDGEVLGLVEFLQGIFGSLVGSLVSGAVSTDEAKCLDTLENVRSNPELDADENRRVGGINGCEQKNVAIITEHYTASDTVENIPLPPNGYDGPVHEVLDISSLFEKIIPGAGTSHTSTAGDNQEEMRRYLFTSTYKNGDRSTEDLRIALFNQDPIYETMLNSGVNDRMLPYLCTDSLGVRKDCQIVKREEVLRAAMRGYVYSKDVASKIGIDLGSDPVSPEIRNNFVVGDDPEMGWLHAPCLVLKNCELGGYIADTAFSSAKVDVKVERPYYGIEEACRLDLKVHDIADGTIQAMFNLVVGPECKAGRISRDGLLWQRMTRNSGGTQNPDAYLLQGCGETCKWTPTGGGISRGIEKLGINFAGPGDGAGYARAQRLKMQFVLELVTSRSELGAVAGRMNEGIGKGMTPIVRICYGSSCEFREPATYAAFLNELAGQVNGEFFAIAGPNEAISEPWLITNPEVMRLYQGLADTAISQKISVMAPLMRAYIQTLRPLVTASNVKLLTPAFNADYPGTEEEIQKIGVDVLSSLDGVAGNAYNSNYAGGKSISAEAGRLKALLPGMPIYLTEVGMIESERFPNGIKIPHSQALENLGKELGVLAKDPDIMAVLLFNSFGTNPDPNFVFNIITDREFATLDKLANAPITSTTVTDPNGPEKDLQYFDPPLTVFYNIPTEIPRETLVTLKETIERKFDLINFLDSIFNPERESQLSLPSSVHMLGKGITDSFARMMLPYKTLQECETVPYDFSLDYTEADPQVNPVFGHDAFGTADLPTKSVTAGDVVHIPAPNLPPVDPANPNPPQPTFNYTISRGVTYQTGITREMADAYKYMASQKCGAANALFPYDLAQAVHQPLPGTSLSLAQTPTGGGVVTCRQDLGTCDKKPISSILGGAMAFSSSTLSPEIDSLALEINKPYNPNSRSIVSLSGMLKEFAQKKAAPLVVAADPWTELSSLQTAEIKEIAVLE